MNKILVISREWLTPKTEFADQTRFVVGINGVSNIIKIDDFRCFQVEYDSGEVVWVTDVNYVRWGEGEKSELENIDLHKDTGNV